MDYKLELQKLLTYCIENRNYLKASESSADRTAADAYQDVRNKIHEIFECEGKADSTSEKDLRVCEVSNSNFTFTVSDNYCTYSYPLNINSHNSVDEVATKIFKAFKLKKEKGKFVKLEDRLVK